MICNKNLFHCTCLLFPSNNQGSESLLVLHVTTNFTVSDEYIGIPCYTKRYVMIILNRLDTFWQLCTSPYFPVCTFHFLTRWPSQAKESVVSPTPSCGEDMICTVSIFWFPFTGMLVHYSVTPTLNSPVPIYTPGRRLGR